MADWQIRVMWLANIEFETGCGKNGFFGWFVSSHQQVMLLI
jgi:hypothetical protein